MIGELIKKERIKHNISQAKLGELLNVTQQAVAKWENAQAEPDIGALTKMSEIFEVSLDYLLENDFTPEEKAAGMSATRKVSITPIEDDLLYTFRQIGKRFGEQAQRDYITVGENMLKLK